jgi:hypothetical protein
MMPTNRNATSIKWGRGNSDQQQHTYVHLYKLLQHSETNNCVQDWSVSFVRFCHQSNCNGCDSLKISFVLMMAWKFRVSTCEKTELDHWASSEIKRNTETTGKSRSNSSANTGLDGFQWFVTNTGNWLITRFNVQINEIQRCINV